ncbi:MAG: hypothetical protein II865_03565 [Bacteroidales bacterium]|nr:hypothetical protein [Bacteroidales bacterium]
MAKNTGKTVCLNYVLDQLRATDKVIAVTSIGLDGEKTDQVTQTEKPEVTLAVGTYFVTTEYHYRQRQLLSEICQLSEDTTSLGRLVTARVLQEGKAILAGPSSTGRIRTLIGELRELGVDLTIVDGALSRKSPASPAVTDGLILTTGAAIAPDLNSIVSKTKFVYQLTQLSEYEVDNRDELMQYESGIYALEEGGAHRLPIASSLLFTKCKDILFSHGNTLFVSGIVTDNMLDYLRMQPNVKDIQLIVKDFTKIFVTPFVLQGFLQKGGRLRVLKRPNLLAMCINPTSPTGFKLESEQLRAALRQVVGVPVYDVVAM